MKFNGLASIVVVLVLSSLLMVAITAEDRSNLKAPNGIALSEFRGYESWQPIAPSLTDDGIKVISGNAIMIKADQDGLLDSGRPVPDGAMMAKVAWTMKSNPQSPYTVTVPGTVSSLSFMVKDSKRFPDTDGWGYAQFTYDAASNTFKAFGADASFGRTVCHACHLTVKERDFVFTAYASR